MKPNGLLILYPVLFGIIGGIIAYLRISHKDQDLATALLKIGIGVTALWVVVVIVIFVIQYTDFI